MYKLTKRNRQVRGRRQVTDFQLCGGGEVVREGTVAVDYTCVASRRAILPPPRRLGWWDKCQGHCGKASPYFTKSYVLPSLAQPILAQPQPPTPRFSDLHPLHTSIPCTPLYRRNVINKYIVIRIMNCNYQLTFTHTHYIKVLFIVPQNSHCIYYHPFVYSLNV